MKNFKMEILSPEGIVFRGETSEVSFPTASGKITVLSGHTNLVTKLSSGEIIIEPRSDAKKISVSGGFVEISNNNVNVVAEFAANTDETNKQKIEKAIELAKTMKSKRKEFVDTSVIESQLRKSVLEIKSGLKLRRKI